MGFYQDIKNAYGVHTTFLMKQWARMNVRLAKFSNRRNFLLRCRKSRILPVHISNMTVRIQGLLLMGDSTNCNQIDNFISNLSFKILSMEIKITCKTISRTKCRLKSIQNRLRGLIPANVFNDYCQRQGQNYKKVFDMVKHNNIVKFKKLSSKSTNPVLFLDNQGWFRNLSNTVFPKKIADFLSLGPKFSIATEKNDFKSDHFLAEVENIIELIPNEERDVLRSKTANILTNYLHSTTRIKMPQLNNTFKKTKTFLRNHPEVYILQADKGGCTVAMDRTEYIEKTQILLSDETTYVQLNRDPTTTVQSNYNSLIKTLLNCNQLIEQVARNLTIYNSTCPKLYCLPKVHKPGTPLRPIVSSVNATTYNISKFLSNILCCAFKDDTVFNIKDTFSFVNAIQGMQLPNNYVLISLDVVSLFTNIPLELVIDIISSEWDKIIEYTTISKNNFINLITFIFQHTYFGFNDKYYRQIFGTPMGSPISPILATIVMDRLLCCVLPKLPFEVPFIYKYVDDIICSIPDGSAQLMLDMFNSFHDRLQFTIEMERDLCVPFLDTKVIRDKQNKIILDWYQKPTATNRYLNFSSNHSTSQKYNTVLGMKNRITHISDDRFLQTNLNQLYNIFINNGYPKRILKKIIFNSTFYDGPLDDDNLEIKYVKLQSVPNLTNKMVKIFNRFPHLKIVKTNYLCNGKLFTKTKQRTPLMFNSSVVYRLPCLGCEGVYIGQTSQWLKNRLTQHRSDCVIGKNSCAVACHHLSTGHVFDYANTKILEYENVYNKRLFLEMCHIIRDDKAINYKTDVNNISNIYCNILSL